MSREWKPGDVVSVRCEEGLIHRAIVANTTWPGGLHVVVPTYALAHDMDASTRLFFGDGAVRPLVTIDPEDREQVERLHAALGSDHWYGTVDYLQAALRVLADPKPKLEEPTGLGAVVEDAEGERYVRHGLKHMDGETTWCDSIGVGRPWSRLNAVRVLSEGVQP